MSNHEEVARLTAEHDGKGWHIAEGDMGHRGPGYRHQVWYGVVLVVAGLSSERVARDIMLRRAKEQAAEAEKKWLEADAHWNFCRSELERLCLMGHKHRCMRCTEEFECPSPRECVADYDVMYLHGEIVCLHRAASEER